MSITAQQIFYGSSPLADEQGYHIIGKSSQITRELEKNSISWFKKLGEYSHDSVIEQALMATSITEHNLKLIAKVSLIEKDSHGRKGTMIGRAILISQNDFREYEADPFVYKDILDLSQLPYLIKNKKWEIGEISIQKEDIYSTAKENLQFWEFDIKVLALANIFGNKALRLPNTQKSIGLMRGLILCTPISQRNSLSISTYSNLYTSNNTNTFDLSINPRIDEAYFFKTIKKGQSNEELLEKAKYVLNLIESNEKDEFLNFIQEKEESITLEAEYQIELDKRELEEPKEIDAGLPYNIDNRPYPDETSTTHPESNIIHKESTEKTVLLGFEKITLSRRYKRFLILTPTIIVLLIILGLVIPPYLSYKYCQRVENRTTSSNTDIYLAYSQFIDNNAFFSRFTQARQKAKTYEQLAEKENYQKLMLLNAEDCEARLQFANRFLSIFPHRSQDREINAIIENATECIELKRLISQINENPLGFDYNLKAIQIFVREYPKSPRKDNLLHIANEISKRLDCLHFGKIVQAFANDNYFATKTECEKLLNRTKNGNLKNLCTAYLNWWDSLSKKRSYTFQVHKRYDSGGWYSNILKNMFGKKSEEGLKLVIRTDIDTYTLNFKNLYESERKSGKISWQKGQKLEIALVDSMGRHTYLTRRASQLQIQALKNTYSINPKVRLEFNLENFEMFQFPDFNCDESPLPLIEDF